MWSRGRVFVDQPHTQASRFCSAPAAHLSVQVCSVNSPHAAESPRVFGSFLCGAENFPAGEKEDDGGDGGAVRTVRGGGCPGLLLFVVTGSSSSLPGSSSWYSRLIDVFSAWFHTKIFSRCLQRSGTSNEQLNLFIFQIRNRFFLNSFYLPPRVVVVTASNMVPEPRFSCSWCVLVVLFLHAVRGSFPRSGSAGSPDCVPGKTGDCPGETPTYLRTRHRSSGLI